MPLLKWTHLDSPRRFVASLTNPHSGQAHEYEIRRHGNHYMAKWTCGDLRAFLHGDNAKLRAYCKAKTAWGRRYYITDLLKHLCEVHLADVKRGYRWAARSSDVDPTGLYWADLWLEPPVDWMSRDV